MKSVFYRLKNKRSKSHSISNRLLRVAVPIVILFFMIVILMFHNLNSAKKLAYRYLEDTASLNATSVNEDIDKINSEIIYLLNNDNTLSLLPDMLKPQDNEYYELYDSLTTLNRTLKYRYGGKYYFYEYVNAADFMIYDNHVLFNTSIKTELELELNRQIKAYISGDIERSEWNFFVINEEIYFFSYYESNGKSVGCVSKLEDLFERFTLNNLGYQGVPFFLDDHNNIMATGSPEVKEKIIKYLSNSTQLSKFFSNYTLYQYQLGRLGELNLLITSENNVLSRILYLQILSIVFILVILIVTGVISYRYYQTVLYPMRKFVDSLNDFDEDKWLHNTENNKLLEIEVASKEFGKLLKQIKALKIAVYEQEIYQNKTELEYVQELVKPHFYLNCLSIIHGKAEMLEATDIALMASKLSNYMRYIINTSYELRSISNELKHLSDYIEIQRFRYGDTFDIEILTENNVDQYLIPPLIIQTFVENSLKHAMNMDETLKITLYMVIEEHKDKDYVYMCLSDTGKGFSQEMLRKLEHNEIIEYDGRKHVGIQNTLKRLEIIYNKDVTLKLSNMSKEYGAVIELSFPAIACKKLQEL